MSLPEISRRCRSCGAAVRAGGRFCPQCGEQVSDAADSSAASAGQDSSAPETREVESLPVVGPTREVESPGEWTPPTKEYAVFAQTFEGAGSGDVSQPQAAAESQGLREDDVAHRADGAAASAGAWSYAAAESPGAGGGAATSGAGDVRGRVARVREGTRARVEKIRDEAIVVLEETPDDSGLRFVVAAAALFVIFLLLLFLSTTVLR